MGRKYDSAAIDPVWREVRDEARAWLNGAAAATHSSGWNRKVRKYSRNARARFLVVSSRNSMLKGGAK